MPPQTYISMIERTKNPVTIDQLIDDNNNNFSPLVDSSDLNKTVKVSNKSKRILKTSTFTFIAQGDFDIVWLNVLVFTVAHLFAIHYLIYGSIARDFAPSIALLFLGYFSGLGITAGAHRLWSHRSYKAKLPLRIFLMLAQTVAGQNCLYVWCRDHRVHHKFSETDADPHNTHRGFFFAHVGWLLRKKHPDVISQSDKLDFTDLLRDPVVYYQMKYYTPLYFIFAFALPFSLVYFSFNVSFTACMSMFIYRYIASLHSTWFVNSTAHMFGDQPYSHEQQARENSFVSFGAIGEGYHNYHHTFPFDYKTAEDGMKLNVTKHFIDLMAWTGQAYDLKTVSHVTVDSVKRKTALHT